MSLARLALRELGGLGDVLQRKLALPLISLCNQQAHRLPPLDRPLEALPAAVLEVLRRRLQMACDQPGGLEALPARELRHAALVLWSGAPQAASFPDLLDTYLQQAAARPRWLRDLLEAWLRDFGSDRVRLFEVGHAIARALSATNHPRLVPWRQAHARFSLFDPTEGARRVGISLLRGPEELEAVMAQIGMTDPLRANGRFFRAAVLESLKVLPTVLASPSASQVWPRAASLLEVQQMKADRQGRNVSTSALRFADLTGDTGKACLMPFVNGLAHASAPKEEIKAFLLRTIADPRVQPARWASVGEEATGQMRSWLAKASLEAFLSLISQTNNDRQWRHRQQFWRACLDKMPTAEVWVVLGASLASRARTIRDLAGSFGLMDGASTNDQAVLLMRIGPLVLSEWSNVGPVRAWDVAGRDSPQLYKTHYTGAQLKAPSLRFPDHPLRQKGGSYDSYGLWHRSGDVGLWQGCAAALLLDRLQLRLTPKDYLE